jgi:hypothetical protein
MFSLLIVEQILPDMPYQEVSQPLDVTAQKQQNLIVIKMFQLILIILPLPEYFHH